VSGFYFESLEGKSRKDGNCFRQGETDALGRPFGTEGTPGTSLLRGGGRMRASRLYPRHDDTFKRGDFRESGILI